MLQLSRVRGSFLPSTLRFSVLQDAGRRRMRRGLVESIRGKVRHHNHSRFSSDLQSATRKLTQFSKCSSHNTHTSFHSRLEPNKFRSPSVKAGHNCTKLATAEQNLRLHEMRNKTPQSFRHIPNVSSQSQQPQELYSLSIPHPRGLMRT